MFIGCGLNNDATLNEVSEAYVKLALELGHYDPDLIDAYYGPNEWKKSIPVKRDTFPYQNLKAKARLILSKLETIQNRILNDDQTLHRANFLEKQLIALETKIKMLNGTKFKFDDEAELLYDTKVPHFEESYFQSLVKNLDQLLPGKGNIPARLEEYKKVFVIPNNKLDTVFKTAINEARKRTLHYIDLPENENFTVEYVNNKAWSAYNWFKGNSFSLIQVNTDLPIYIERAIDLACHEGYPGHHVFNVLIEQNLVNKKGWKEYSVYPLFSPQSLIAEGSGNLGIEVAFPGNERLEFEKNSLFPLAGIPSEKAEKYFTVLELVSKLSYAGNEAARSYLDGEISSEEAINWLNKYALMEPNRATQRLKFIEKYRSYVINYNYGRDLIRSYINKNGGTEDNKEKRWDLFKELLSQPKTASML
jgi:hypothetical protein